MADELVTVKSDWDFPEGWSKNDAGMVEFSVLFKAQAIGHRKKPPFVAVLLATLRDPEHARAIGAGTAEPDVLQLRFKDVTQGRRVASMIEEACDRAEGRAPRATN